MKESTTSKSDLNFLPKLINLIVITILGIAFFIIDLIFGSTFMQASTKGSLAMVKYSQFFEVWFSIFTYPFYFAIQGGIYLILYYLKRKDIALKFFCLILIHNIISETIKLIYKDTRPCFENDIIGQAHCSCSFGKFSGHSSGSMLFYLLFYREIIHDLKIRTYSKALWLTAAIFVIINVGLSRVYFGAHSFNQVILGFFFGYLIFSVNLLFRNRINNDFAMFLLIKESQPKDYIIYKKISIIVFLLISNGLLLLFWGLNITSFEKQPDDYIGASFCGRKCQNNGAYLSDSHLTSGAFANSVLFIFLILLAFNVSPSYRNSEYYKESFPNFLFCLKRIIWFVFVTGPIIIAYIASNFVDYIGSYFMVLGCTLVYGVTFRYLLPVLLRKTKCSVQGDFFLTQKVVPVNTHELLLTNRNGERGRTNMNEDSRVENNRVNRDPIHMV